MREYSIQTPGEKIKCIRKRFNINQEDITGGEITRNLISMVENNKVNLTEPVAKVLTNAINVYCKENNIEFSITEDYLLEDVVTQAKKVADEYISYIENLNAKDITLINDVLNEINLFLRKYNVEEKKSIIYLKIAAKFKSCKNYQEALAYYLKAFESSIENKFTLYSLEMVANCNVFLSKYTEALNYYTILLDLATDVALKYHTKFNIALCYKKLDRFEDALVTLNKIIDEHNELLTSSHNDYLEVHLLMGICLYESKSFNDAIANYEFLLKTLTHEHLKEEIFILINLADVYRTLKDTLNLEKICNKILDKINDNAEFMNVYEAGLYISLSRNLRAINQNDTANYLLLKAFECYKTADQTVCADDIKKMVLELLDIYIENNDIKKISHLKNDYFELIEKGLFPRESIVTLKFIRYYSSINNLKEVTNIVDFIAS